MKKIYIIPHVRIVCSELKSTVLQQSETRGWSSDGHHFRRDGWTQRFDRGDLELDHSVTFNLWEQTDNGWADID